MAESVKLADCYVQIIPSMQGAQGLITAEMSGMASAAGSASGAALGSSFMASAGSMLSKFALPAALLAAGAYLVKVGGDFDEMYDIIITGTGATGEALDDLEQSARNVAQAVPNDFNEIGQTIADLNTRMGLTGDELEDMAEQYLRASNALGTTVDVNKTTAAFNAFNLEGEAASDALDDLFTVSQQTGIGMNELAGAVSSNAASMQALGFSFEETAAMAGLLDKSGIDANSTFSQMSRGLVKLAKDGEEPAEAFERTTQEIQAFIDAGDEASALKLASELFGTKGAPKFIAALKSGSLNVEELTEALENNEDAIDKNAAMTESFADKLKTIWNNLLIVLEPIASALFDAISWAIENVLPYVQKAATFISEAVRRVMDVVRQIVDFVKKVVSGDWKGAWETLKNLATNALKSLWEGVKSIGGKVIDWIKALPGRIVSAIGSLARALFEKGKELLQGFWDGVKAKWNEFVEWFGSLSVNGVMVGNMFVDVPSLRGEGVQVKSNASGGIYGRDSIVRLAEAGREAIVPLTQPNMQPFADAVAAGIGRGEVTNVYIDNARINDDEAMRSATYDYLMTMKRYAKMQGA